MDIKYVEDHTIFLTVIGSRAYGTSRLDSDYDQAGVMVPGIEYFYGIDKFEQFQGFPGIDKTIFDIRKALILMAGANPNMLDLLFGPERCILKMTPFWKKILENREAFISKKCRHTFSGYAFAQLVRIATHRKFLLNPLTEFPTREKFGLKPVSVFPTSQLKAIVYSALGDIFVEEEKENFLSELDDIYSSYIIPLYNRYVIPEKRTVALDYLQVGTKSQANTLTSLGSSYIKDEYLEEARKELCYYEASKEWEQYQNWKKHRNKSRAIMEEKFGYDCKHAMHLVRLIRMCKEILETGKVNVDRTLIDAEELKTIRDGAWSYEQVEEYAQKMDNEAGKLYFTSNLKKSPDMDKIKTLCIETCQKYLRDSR